MSRGNSFANGGTNSGNSMNTGLSESGNAGPGWQRILYGWLADPNLYTWNEPGGYSG